MTATVRGISPLDRSGSVDAKGEREYSVVYKVTTDDWNDGPGQVRTAFGIPAVGNIYAPGNDADLAAVVISKVVRSTDSPWEWEVEVTWSTQIDRQPVDSSLKIDNPLDRPPAISYGFQGRSVLIPGRHNDPENVQEGADFDRGIYAPNGELFDPQPEMEVDEPVLTISRAVKTINGPAMMALADCVNSDNWQGAYPRQLRLRAPEATINYHVAIGSYWDITYRIVYRYSTWDMFIENRGSYYYNGGAPTSVWSTTAKRLTKVDEMGMPTIVGLSTGGDINTTGTPTFTRLRVRREVAFASLGIL